MIRFLAGLILGAAAATYLIAWLLTSSRVPSDDGSITYRITVHPNGSTEWE